MSKYVNIIVIQELHVAPGKSRELLEDAGFGIQLEHQTASSRAQLQVSNDATGVRVARALRKNDLIFRDTH